MTFENITTDEFDTVDVEPKGIYFFKAGAPAERVLKYDKYENGEGVEGTEYEAIQLFLVANQQAIYDDNRNLEDTEDITGVALNMTIKLGHPEKKKYALTQLKSWWMVNHGSYPPTTDGPNGKQVIDMDMVMQELHTGDGAWGSIGHFKTQDNKIIAFVGGRFTKEPPKKAPKEKD